VRKLILAMAQYDSLIYRENRCLFPQRVQCEDKLIVIVPGYIVSNRERAEHEMFRFLFLCLLHVNVLRVLKVNPDNFICDATSAHMNGTAFAAFPIPVPLPSSATATSNSARPKTPSATLTHNSLAVSPCRKPRTDGAAAAAVPAPCATSPGCKIPGAATVPASTFAPPAAACKACMLCTCPLPSASVAYP